MDKENSNQTPIPVNPIPGSENLSNPEVSPSSTAPLASPTPAGVENQPNKSGNKISKILKIFIPVVILVVFGVIVYFLIDKLNTPAKVKEKASISQPIFIDLEKVNKKIIAHLKESSSVSDPDSVKREAVKGQELIDSAKKSRKELQTNMQDVKVVALDEYKKYIDSYLIETDKIIALEEDNVKIFNSYVEPIRQYQKLTLDISGASTYLLSDPAKYVDILNNAITSEEAIIQDLKKIKVQNSLMQDLHNEFVSSLETESEFLIQMRDAVEKRNTAQIAVAEKKFVESSQLTAKEHSRIVDELNNSVDEIGDSLDSLSDKIKEEYTGLKGEYDF